MHVAPDLEGQSHKKLSLQSSRYTSTHTMWCIVLKIFFIIRTHCVRISIIYQNTVQNLLYIHFLFRFVSTETVLSFNKSLPKSQITQAIQTSQQMKFLHCTVKCGSLSLPSGNASLSTHV